jgi:type VI protein secretion system component Hcp
MKAKRASKKRQAAKPVAKGIKANGNVELDDHALGEIKGGRDIASGQATGKRMHKPFLITKEYDKATPLLG